MPTKAKKIDLTEVNSMMDNVINDSSVPRNIRKSLSDAKERIAHMDDSAVDLSTAIYALDEAVNDINMPFHTRTELMSIISLLERIKEDANPNPRPPPKSDDD